MTGNRIRDSKRNPFFQVKVKDGKYSTENQVSYYGKKLPDDTFSFDVSNQKVQANLDEFGTIRHITFFHGNYLMESKPGVWVAKDFVQEHQLSVSVKWNGQTEKLCEHTKYVEMDLAENLFPRCRHYFPWGEVTILATAPITAKGERLSCLLYEVTVKNTGREAAEMTVCLPALYEKKYSDTRNVLMITAESGTYQDVSFTLQPMEQKRVSLLFGDPNRYQDIEMFLSKDTDFWMEQTLQYFRSLTGELKMEEDAMAGMLLQRAYQQAFGAFAMSGENEILGSNWGTYPVTPHVWNKDMYYSSLPFTLTEPELCKKCILWFAKYGIKYKGTKFEGGVFHSLSNSLSVIMLSGAYYEYFGEKEFFQQHPKLYKKMKEILQTVLESREENEPYLYRTTWISDAYALGKYHTGTNLCMYRSFMALARIAEEVFGEKSYAEMLRSEAGKTRKDIERYMTAKGLFGTQYLEGISGIAEEKKECDSAEKYQKEMLDQGLQFITDVNHDGEICLRMHDGEESDTTLMKYYKYQSEEQDTLKQYGQFTGSRENPTYSELSRGIKWGNQSGATFPGYISILNGAAEKESWSGDEGRFRELERLTDLDGSWWWWPYKIGAQTGDVVRMNSCGKCGWGAGIFFILFITEFLGIEYDAPKAVFRIHPKRFIGGFCWKNMRIGNARFDISVRYEHHMAEFSMKNRSTFPVYVEMKKNQKKLIPPNNEEKWSQDYEFIK